MLTDLLSMNPQGLTKNQLAKELQVTWRIIDGLVTKALEAGKVKIKKSKNKWNKDVETVMLRSE